MTPPARLGLAAIVLAALCLAQTTPLSAHRLDEYLQTARLSVAVDRIGLEMDLTPGVAMAPAVFAMIDTDGNGQWSQAEIDAYARQVIGALVLTIDGRPARLALDRAEAPTWEAMKQGVGAIRLRASALAPAASPGDHHVIFRNAHRPVTSVYLANALVPLDGRIEITGQDRDALQSQLTINYRMAPANSGPWTSGLPPLAGLAVAAALIAWRPKLRRR
jgi:hypothetical protein